MNSFGENFRITIFGASHAPVIGITIEGVPAGLQLDPADFTEDILRRKSGRKGTTPRIEKDIPIIESGVRKRDDGTMVTSGEPMTITFENKNIRPQDYASLKNIPRPGHADFTAYMKYSSHKGDFENTGFTGGGIFSGRMTLPLVGAGVVAKKIISPIEIRATLIEVGGIPIGNEEAVEALLEKTIEEGDSLGGIIECICTNIPAGLGEPFFNSVESLISHAIFSIPGIRGIEFGDGFSGTESLGSKQNDQIESHLGVVKFLSNHAGGINGGITNGNTIVFTVGVKPPSSIKKPQTTINVITDTNITKQITGKHDPCIVHRVLPVVEALTAFAIYDLWLETQHG